MSELVFERRPRAGAARPVLTPALASQRTRRASSSGHGLAFSLGNAPQFKLRVSTPGDSLEREADRAADTVLSAQPSKPQIGQSGPQAQRACSACEEEEQTVAREANPGSHSTGVASAAVSQGVSGMVGSQGSPLSARTRGFFEPRFGEDFSDVRVHMGPSAAAAADALQARAFTLGRDIVFNRGQASDDAEGTRLLAHELAHVVQQRGGSQSSTAEGLIQRDTFTGGPGKEIKRPLIGFDGPMPFTASPGGTVVPGTASPAMNCAGDSCSISKWLNWPFLGIDAPKGTPLPAGSAGDWAQANSFVPDGCSRVSCSGVNVNNTRCKNTELELVTFLYRWPIAFTIGGVPYSGTQSDFHMIGRDAGALPRGWHSKMDRRERVVDIREPVQSLHDAYPHTLKPDREINQLCFCCNQSKINAT